MRTSTLPYAVTAKRLARMFDLSVRTIQRWDQAGMLTRLQGPSASPSGGRAPVRYVVQDFIKLLEAQPGSRTGTYQRFASIGDVLR